ncbi:MAG: diacylglycerol kinase catalytic domain family protein [Chthoniobacteraceae bacterium]|nr:diacylglycerol kinase catalytic domain family protein [Chthoniobacteraceae bacterium]
MIVILNSTAGQKPGGEQEKIAALFRAHGVEAHVIRAEDGSSLCKLARKAVADGEQIIVAGGGDGTISAVAAELVDSGKTLGVLPLGTLNHFAKDLKIPQEVEAAIAVIVAGHVQQVDVGEVNGSIFVNNSSLGLYPRIVSKREQQQEQLKRGKWPAFVSASIDAFRRYPFMNLRIAFEGKQLLRRTAFVFIGNNEYEVAGFKLGGRKCLNAGNLGLYLTHRTGRLGMLRLAFRALFGRVNQAADFDSFCVEEALIETRKKKLLVATDGEVTMMATPLRYRIRRSALRVIVPGEAVE